MDPGWKVDGVHDGLYERKVSQLGRFNNKKKKKKRKK